VNHCVGTILELSKLVHQIQELQLDDSVIQWRVIDVTCSVQCC